MLEDGASVENGIWFFLCFTVIGMVEKNGFSFCSYFLWYNFVPKTHEIFWQKYDVDHDQYSKMHAFVYLMYTFAVTRVLCFVYITVRKLRA